VAYYELHSFKCSPNPDVLGLVPRHDNLEAGLVTATPIIGKAEYCNVFSMSYRRKKVSVDGSKGKNKLLGKNGT
jgi:hypothetical protein